MVVSMGTHRIWGLQLCPHHWTWPHTLVQEARQRHGDQARINKNISHALATSMVWRKRHCTEPQLALPIGSMYGIYANIWGTLMVNVTIYIYIHTIHQSYGLWWTEWSLAWWLTAFATSVEGQLPGVGHLTPFQRSKSHPDPWSVVDFHAPECGFVWK